ncbi:MAG TPA: hypothetical protein VN714_02590 [Trebonia sp.]|nr:hypothetical protein [Trebonia sp.]
MSQPTVIVQPSIPTVIASAAGAPGPQGPSGGGASALTRTALQTGNYNAAAGDLVPVDTTTAPVTVTLPNAPADKTQVAVELVTQGGANTATLACAGSDVLSKTGGPTTLTLPLLGQAAWLEYTAAAGIWTPLSLGFQLAALDARYAQLASDLSDLPNPATARASLGLGTAATANTGAFDPAGAAAAALAAAEANAAGLYLPLAGGALTGPLALGSHKVTGVANGAAPDDAAAFGQIPTAGATAGTYAAGNDSRITGAAQKASNLSDLANPATARANLGLGTQAQQNFSTVSGALAEVIAPWNCGTSGGSPLTSGVLILNLIRPGPILVTNLAIWLTLAGATASGANGLALYDETGNLIDQTADLSAQFATLGLIEAPLGAQHQLAANTSYYVGVLAHFSGTTPKAGSALAAVAIPVMRGHYLSLTKSSIASFPASFTPSTYATSTAAYAMQMS